ncbi:MAG: VWA domain-containing protein [Byssovorax sp.]
MLKADDPCIFFLLGFALTVGAAACSATSSTTSGATTNAGGSGSGSGSGSGGTGGEALVTTATSTSAAGGLDAGPDPDAACGLITEEAKSTPLDLYIAFDRSSSLAGFKWDNAKLGLSAFVNDPDSAGIGVALNFFPLENTPTTCDQFAYQPPKVDFAPLPANAMPITAAMAAAAPTGFSTPIYPALGGAILGAKAYAQSHAGHVAAVLLVSDGAPEGPSGMCGSVNPEDPQVIADLAKAGFAPPFGIRTFVVGLPGVSSTIANQIAVAGGTDAAILVGGVDVKTEFQTALAKVRGQALPCEYQLPGKVEGGEVNPGDVNVLITPNGGSSSVLPQDTKCADKGWRYDDPQKPTKIVFCPSSCKALKTTFDVKVQILLGCKTEIAK